MPVVAAPPDSGSMNAIFTSASASPAHNASATTRARTVTVMVFSSRNDHGALTDGADANGPPCGLQGRRTETVGAVQHESPVADAPCDRLIVHPSRRPQCKV